MLGVSLGSFLLREYLTKYPEAGEIAGAIIMGTGHHNYVWAQYYSPLSAFYDHALGGAYDAVEADEELLLKKMMDATDKTIRYARKSHRPGSKHVLAENLLAKGTMLMRSEPERNHGAESV